MSTTTIPIRAAEIATLATAALQGPLQALAASFQRESGHTVNVQFDTSPNIARRIATGELPDVLVGMAAAVDQAIKDGKALGDSRVPIGRIGLGVAMSRGGSPPDISSVDALRQSLTRADAVVYSQGASGVYVEKLFREMGIADQLKSKTAIVPNGDAVSAYLGASRGNETGFTMISEIMYGEARGGGSLVGPLPSAIQSFTSYEAVVMSASREKEAARQFVRALASPVARKQFTQNGWEVPDEQT